MRLRSFAHPLAALALATLLAGCGGGGDSGNSGFIPPTTDFAAQQAWKNLLTTGGTWVVSGTVQGSAVVATLTVAAAGTKTFPVNNVDYSVTNFSSNLKVGGVDQGTSLTEYFRDASFQIQRVRTTFNGAPACGSGSAQGLPSIAAKVNAQGRLVTVAELSSCTSAATPTGATEIAKWSIGFDRGVVFLCLNSDSRDSAGQAQGTEQDCVEINEAGGLGTRALVIITTPGLPTVTLTNF